MRVRKIVIFSVTTMLVLSLIILLSITSAGNIFKSDNFDGTVLSTSAVQPNMSNNIIKGDLNGNERVDIFDLCLAKRDFIYGFSNNNAEKAADINGDGKVGIDDIKQIQDFLLTRITKFTEAQPIDSPESLVVYYSYSGNTDRIALRLAELTGSDTFEIETVQTYPDDPHETALVSQKERSSGSLPELKETPDISKYDMIYIAGPIWNAYMSTPLEKYMELTDFSGKKIAPLSTSMGSGQTGYLNDFRSRAKNPDEIAEYLDIRFPGNGQPDAFTDEQIDEKLKPWIEKLSTPSSDSVDFNFETKKIKLNSGYDMPIIGLGTWTLNDETVENSVYYALKDGYRLIDKLFVRCVLICISNYINKIPDRLRWIQRVYQSVWNIV